MSVLTPRKQKPKAPLEPWLRAWLLDGTIPREGQPGRSEVLCLHFFRGRTWDRKARVLWRRHRAELMKVKKKPYAFVRFETA